MSTWKSALLAGAMAFAPLHAAAQEAPDAEIVAADMDEAAEPTAEESLAATKERMQREMEQAVALVEKMFDTSDLPPIQPARLALAETTTAALLPPGSLEKMIDNLYGKMFATILKEIDGTSDLMITIKTGVDGEQVAALDDKSKEAIADLFDPHRKQRQDQIMKIVRPLLSEVLTDIESPMRGGMAKAYARKFSAEQLAALNSFFATPDGQFYANESMALQADPEIMLAVVRAVPPMVTKFIDRAPELEEKFKGEFQDLPKDRQLADLNDAELRKLAKLMKVDVKTLKDHRDMQDAAIDAAADAADAAAEPYDEFSYDRDQWSAADRERYEQAEKQYFELGEEMETLRQQAADNARKTKQKQPST